MKRSLLSVLILLGAGACNLLQVKPTPDPFYKIILEQNPNNRAALYAQGRRFMSEGHYAQALPFIEQLAKESPQNAGAWFDLGRCTYELHKYGQSRKAFQKALELQPSEGALLGLAAATLLGGDAADAARLAEQSASKYGISAGLLQIKGDIAYFTGEAAEACKFYRQSLQKDPNQRALQQRVKDLEDFLSSAG